MNKPNRFVSTTAALVKTPSTCFYQWFSSDIGIKLLIGTQIVTSFGSPRSPLQLTTKSLPFGNQRNQDPRGMRLAQPVTSEGATLPCLCSEHAEDRIKQRTKPRHVPGWNAEKPKPLNLSYEACYWFLYLKEKMHTVSGFLLSTFCKREEKEKDYEDDVPA